MKLYQLTKEDVFTLREYPQEGPFIYVKTDGMYSMVTDMDNVVGFIAAFIEVVKETDASNTII